MRRLSIWISDSVVYVLEAMATLLRWYLFQLHRNPSEFSTTEVEMRNYKTDEKYKTQNDIPFAFAEGDRVIKRDGDYTFEGMVIACVRKRSGAARYVVENDAGIMHILNHNQLVKK